MDKDSKTNDSISWIDDAVKKVNSKQSLNVEERENLLTEIEKNEKTLQETVHSLSKACKIDLILENGEKLYSLFRFYSINRGSKLGFLPIIGFYDELIKYREIPEHPDQKRDFSDLLERVSELRDGILKYMELTNSKKEKQDDNMKITFREEPILSSSPDFLFNVNLPLNLIPHIKKGSYVSWEFYLNNIFLLLREVLFFFFLSINNTMKKKIEKK